MPISEKSPSGLNRELLQREAGDDISGEGTQRSTTIHACLPETTDASHDKVQQH